MAERLERKLIQVEFYKIYNSKVIYYIFFTIFLSNVFINIDHGSLPGCSIEIKNDLDMNDFQFGMLGSIVYGGLTLGAGVATGVYSNPELAKPTLTITLILNSVCIFLFTMSNSFYIDAGLRFAIGFFQVFSCIYMPVWADAFANEK
jgi:sugar phosphate permease